MIGILILKTNRTNKYANVFEQLWTGLAKVLDLYVHWQQQQATTSWSGAVALNKTCQRFAAVRLLTAQIISEKCATLSAEKCKQLAKSAKSGRRRSNEGALTLGYPQRRGDKLHALTLTVWQNTIGAPFYLDSSFSSFLTRFLSNLAAEKCSFTRQNDPLCETWKQHYSTI